MYEDFAPSRRTRHSLKSLNSKRGLGHTYSCQSSCSRASVVTAPVLSDDREATRVRLRRELGNC
jgi:hypothetical protein